MSVWQCWMCGVTFGADLPTEHEPWCAQLRNMNARLWNAEMAGVHRCHDQDACARCEVERASAAVLHRYMLDEGRDLVDLDYVPGFEVRRPLQAQLACCAKVWRAEWETYWGIGPDRAQAVRDLASAISAGAELLRKRRRNGRRFGGALATTWDKLCQHLKLDDESEPVGHEQHD